MNFPETSVRSSYDAAARRYAEELFHELERKPFDRHLLNRFAETLRGAGTVADLGCGPGHVARYLATQGVDAIGIDLSPEMVRVAGELNPVIPFRVGDMRGLDLGDATLAGAVACYSIVHFEPAELPALFLELRRALRSGALLLVAFHIGDAAVHLDELFGVAVSLDFRFHQPVAVAGSLRDAGFQVIEATEREPYEGAEHPSRRCYLLARALD